MDRNVADPPLPLFLHQGILFPLLYFFHIISIFMIHWILLFLFQQYWKRKNTTNTYIFRGCTSTAMWITSNRFRNSSWKIRGRWWRSSCSLRQNDSLSHQSRPDSSCKEILELPTESNESAEPCFIWWFFHSFNCLPNFCIGYLI